MQKLELYEGGSDLLASPLTNHLIAYNPSSTAQKPAATGISARIQQPLPTKTITTPATTTPAKPPVVVDVSGTGIEASLGLNQSVSLTGSANSPATPADSNSPGLNNEGEGAPQVKPMKPHWILIVLILAVIAGLIYWYNPGNVMG